MSSVHYLRRPFDPPEGPITVGAAVAAFVATLSRPAQAATARTYRTVLNQLVSGPFADGEPLAFLAHRAGSGRLQEWFTVRWGGAAPATWNRNLAVLRSAVTFWRAQGWLSTDPTEGLRRMTEQRSAPRARDRAAIEELLGRSSVGLRERALWALAYESAARAQELLGLDVAELDLGDRRAVVRRKGGAVDVIVWQTRTARLLGRYLGGRRAGPVFLTARAARVPLAPADLDASGRARLSYRRAAELFVGHSGGWTLHDLRDSALTHAAEDGMSTPVLMAFSGHTSIRSLARYSRPSGEALVRWHAEHDPTSRRGGR